MSANKEVTPENFGNEFERIVDAYMDNLDKQLEKDIKEVAKFGKKELQKAPAGAGKYYDWEAYSKGWGYRTDRKNFGQFVMVLENKKKPGLTHLLEKGHINRDGKTRAKAFPHIEPAAEEIFKEFERRINNGKK